MDENQATTPKLTAEALKNSFWETLQAVKKGELTPGEADSVAVVGREILRTVRVQTDVCRLSKMQVPEEVKDFVNSKQ